MLEMECAEYGLVFTDIISTLRGLFAKIRGDFDVRDEMDYYKKTGDYPKEMNNMFESQVILERGLEQGLEQGLVKGKIESALNGIRRGLPLDIIVAVTEFEPAFLEQLQQNPHVSLEDAVNLYYKMAGQVGVTNTALRK
jgi:hypothetical protein